MQNSLRRAAREFLPQFPEDESYAVSLTMKQHSQARVLDRQAASQNLRHCLNLMNRKVYKNAFSRHGKKIEVIPVLETSHSGRLHYHLLIRNPRPENGLWFRLRFLECWQQTDFADKEHKFDDAYDVNGWLQYITKHDVKNIDWENFHAS